MGKHLERLAFAKITWRQDPPHTEHPKGSWSGYLGKRKVMVIYKHSPEQAGWAVGGSTYFGFYRSYATENVRRIMSFAARAWEQEVRGQHASLSGLVGLLDESEL